MADPDYQQKLHKFSPIEIIIGILGVLFAVGFSLAVIWWVVSSIVRFFFG